MFTKKQITRALEQLIHWLLFAVSAVFSIRLFFELASTPLDKLLYASLAVGFEGTKIVLWEVGSKRQRLIALAMVLMSLVASTGAALSVANRASQGGLDEGTVASFTAQISAIDTQATQLNSSIAALTTQASQLPPVYVSAAERLQKQISLLYDRSTELSLKRLELEKSYHDYKVSAQEATSATTMFRLMSDALGIAETTFVLYFMLAVAVLLEVGALGTTERSGVNASDSTMASLLPCSCRSKRTSIDRSADGVHWSVGCKSCGMVAGMHDSEQQAKEVWNSKQTVKIERRSLWEKMRAKLSRR
jgi:hypothetical protein